ncbi:hypothetical protein Scep_016580 [Stephania cephalantha]|uniref:DOG1 domain-containing protein n=1 Tax=Stephania cephalantha TaxID=152367 RepID=A0AAP0IPU5_9MAGN
MAGPSSMVGMQGFSGNTVIRSQTCFPDLGEIEESTAGYSAFSTCSPNSIFSLSNPSGVDVGVAVVPPFKHSRLRENIDVSEICSPYEMGICSGYYNSQKGRIMPDSMSIVNEQFENDGDSGIGDASLHTDTSMDVDKDDINQFMQNEALISVDSVERAKSQKGGQKTFHRLAQNREAARKSRLKKKAYVQQLESSQLKLNQMEQELKRMRQQGMLMYSGYTGDQCQKMAGTGASSFNAEYARWLDAHRQKINNLQLAINANVGDNDLRTLVDGVIAHYDDMFRLKSMGAKHDVFHMLSGMWTTPVERCFMWLGGFRSSELLRILGDSLEPLTDQQVMSVCNLQQSSVQAEDALSQGMEALQQSLAESLSSASLGPSGSGNVSNYMSQMAIAMGKLGTLENFLHQADLLRQQTMRQMHRILTTRQAARALLVINDYFSRLRALSSLWLLRSRNRTFA